MYFTLNYDIISKEQSEIVRINSFIKDSLNQYKLNWTKPISNFYIIKCSEERIRNEIFKRLILFTQNSSNLGKVRFLLSPLFDDGPFVGLLQKDFWPQIKNITKSDLSDLEEIFGK
ncbi:MAG: hypothetical protein NTU73_08460 [Ignavibacteriae bacterium]|nr:hypothetical protein [Ignavibacteriota bacterium]